MHVSYPYTGMPLSVLTVNARWLQAFSGAEDSFVPALGHFVLLLCQSPTGTLLTPSCNCLHVAKTPKIRVPKSCLVGFCFPTPPPFFWSVFSFRTRTVKDTDLYQLDTVRKVKAHEGGEGEEKAGKGWVGCGASSPVSAGRAVTHW